MFYVVGMEEDFFPQKFWKKYLHHLNNLVKPFPKQFQFQDLLQKWKRYRSLIFISFHVFGGEIDLLHAWSRHIGFPNYICMSKVNRG